ncbi:MAG: ArsR family transcriptional regulator [Euryarchaeota archaeon]|nr:ArsR family transcriptional regulator [Euryarchaeota archaeon]
MGAQKQQLTEAEIQPQHIVTDMAQVKAIVDPVRLTILELLAEEEMTSRQLSDELNISQQLTYHHLQKLIESGLVTITRTGKRGNLEIYYYRAIANSFEFSLPPINKEAIAAEIERHALEDRVIEERDWETAEVLEKMGFKVSSMPEFIDWSNKEASFFIGSYKRLMERIDKEELSAKQWEAVVAALRLATLASMKEEELDAWFDTVRQAKEVIRD